MSFCPQPWVHEYQADGQETNCGADGCPYPTLADDLATINEAAAHRSRHRRAGRDHEAGPDVKSPQHSRVFGARLSHREWFPRWDLDPLVKTLLLILALLVFPAWVLRERLRGQL